MRRIATVALLAAAVAAVVVVLVQPWSKGGDPYDVRAVFDNASAIVTGEDVRIAGAPVGTVTAENVTSAKQAAITLEIDKSAFVPFHANASCTIRVQSVIGEKFVDCTPGTSSQSALTRIRRGSGSGQYYLPVTRTRSPVDFDIVQGISRQSQREQFALILNELGTGLAARGSDLNEVIRRADPALGNTDRVLKILARENRVLAQLATDSNTVLKPLAQFKRQLAGFVVHSNTTAVASAARATDIQRSFHLLPQFLHHLRPLMVDLGHLADQGTPLFNSLSQAAPSINSQYQNLAAFARATRTSLIALGQSAVKQQPALLATIPLDRRLERLGRATAPSATLLARLLASFKNTGGIEDLMSLLINGAGATNGFDADGHYIRTESLFGSCTPYAVKPVFGCSSLFSTTASAAADVGASAAGAHSGGASAKAHPSAATQVALRVLHKQKSTGTDSSGTLSGLLQYLIGGKR
ncbi:MAG TPA: MlaD family protein [Solirubrobacteraceae bacterium]|jgi:ABC-type transporter Mla subunit MlaD